MRTPFPNGQGGPAPNGDRKKALRAEADRLRAAAKAADPEAGDALVNGFRILGARAMPRHGDIVAAYAPIRSEIDPGPLMAELCATGARPALPRTGPEGLSFHLTELGETLVPGAFGVLEPPARAPAVRPNLLLLPCLAFDARGHRLGYGKGYYDRALEGLRAEGGCLAILLAYAAQEVPALPEEGHDVPADAIVTEQGARWCAGARGKGRE